MTATVWREDPTPVVKLIDAYRAKPESYAPTHGAAQRTRTRLDKERQLLAELPSHRRPAARIALKLAERYLPMRGVGKVAFLQALDVARAAARRVGDLLVTDGLIDDREDVFFLTLNELAAGCPPDARELINARRPGEQRQHQRHRLGHARQPGYLIESQAIFTAPDGTIGYGTSNAANAAPTSMHTNHEQLRSERGGYQPRQ